MPATARPPERRAFVRRYRAELGWVAFALANYAVMIAVPEFETIPFHFVWISLTLLYGFRVWQGPATLAVLVFVMTATTVAIGLDAFHGIDPWTELFEVPLMAAMFLAMVWHARRRVEAQRAAEDHAERRRSLLARQERFVQDASHELRTPMTIARGHLELLRTQLGPTAELEVALDELSRIDVITDRLLLLAHAEQPGFVRRVALELEPLLEDMFMRWSEVAPRTWRLGALAPGQLLADPERLRVAIDSLLENAVKYSAPGAVIELSARREDAGIAIEVRDEGPGVPPTALSRIFDRFARADAARTGSAGGVGLGLAIVDAIIKAHDGRCSVVSMPGETTFSLHLPHFTLDAASAAAAPATMPAADEWPIESVAPVSG
ncbi:MAG TPA: HAMP domain-containing sensor histidine kinase [Solirubrobacteraceae bacterium]|nr:HAMP domain-containing sensor histidine kinase [Solirubrobacteraceae bacterium]